MRPQRAGDLFALACALVCGLGNIPAKAALDKLTTEIFNIYFFLFAFVISLLSFLSKKQREEIKDISLKVLGLIFVLAILFGLALYLFMMSLKMIEPATVSFLSRFEVILTVVLAYMFLRERLRPLEILGGMVAVAGIFILKYKTTLVISQAATLMVLSSLVFAIAEIIVKKYVYLIGTARFILYRNFFLIFISYAVMKARGQSLHVPPTDTLLLIFVTALLLPVFGRATRMEALKRIDISRAALITQSTPLFTAFFALVILSTYPTPIEWLGGGLIIAGVVVIQLYKGRIGAGLPH